MHPVRSLHWLYLANAAVLIAHEIDSAYWREWELFGIPGGIQLFVVLNFGLVLLVLYGQQALCLGRPAGVVLAWALALGNLFAAVVHAGFIVLGSPAFRLPVSVALLVAAFVLSLALAAILLRNRGAARAAGSP